LSLLRSLGPSVAHVSAAEALRAGFGALLGLGLTGLFVLSPAIDTATGLFLVAPLGATSVLVFAVPNSPLAQPWSAVVGNVVAALVAVAICMAVADPVLRVALSVGAAITATILCRALHPPAGAVAMTAALSPGAVEDLGFWFALTPVAAGTVTLVACAALYARATGRHYPLRRFDEPAEAASAASDPVERSGLGEDELAGILDRYRQSFNLGVRDLARLIGAAELQAATHGRAAQTAGDVMSRDLVTIDADTPLAEVADLFRRHRFTSLPVTGPGARFLGIIFQIHLIARARDDALRLDRGFAPAIRRLVDRDRDRPVRAAEIMSVAGPRATEATPLGALLPMMADGAVDAVPVLERRRIVGIVTRTDLIAALAREAVRRPDR